MRKIKIVLLLFIFSLGKVAVAQNVVIDNSSSNINVATGFSLANGYFFDFSIGEMVLTETYSVGSNFLLSQGFLQPYFLFNLTPPIGVIIANNVITPNADGKNDVFVIIGLQNYNMHKLSIFDRAGKLVFVSTNYQNNWDGTLKGKVLNEDAYYYRIELGNGILPIKGSVSIVLDK